MYKGEWCGVNRLILTKLLKLRNHPQVPHSVNTQIVSSSPVCPRFTCVRCQEIMLCRACIFLENALDTWNSNSVFMISDLSNSQMGFLSTSSFPRLTVQLVHAFLGKIWCSYCEWSLAGFSPALPGNLLVSGRTEGERKRTRGQLFSLNLYTLMHSCKEFKKFKFEFSLPGFYEGIFIFQGRNIEHVI